MDSSEAPGSVKVGNISDCAILRRAKSSQIQETKLHAITVLKQDRHGTVIRVTMSKISQDVLKSKMKEVSI
jgi:hypothetical protein